MKVYATGYELLEDGRVSVEVQGGEGDLYRVIVHGQAAGHLLGAIDAGGIPEALEVEEWLLHPWTFGVCGTPGLDA